jgi:hypothetical protein
MPKLLAVLLFALPAFAEERPQELTAPPPWLPYRLAPGPSPSDIEALDLKGRHDARIGGVLMAAGGTVALMGTGLLIAGDWEEHCSGVFHHHHDDHGCGSSVMAIMGATTALAGTALFAPGLILLIHGSRDSAHARALKRSYWGPVSLQPTLGPLGGGVSVRISH